MIKHLKRNIYRTGSNVKIQIIINLKDNDDLTMMIRNENIYAEKPDPESSNDNGKMRTNVERVQPSIDHPSGKTSFDSVEGSSIGNHMKSAHIANASRDMEYSPKREGIDFRRLTDSAPDKVDNAFASEVESETVHVT